LITAYMALRERGAEILAIYHSHPRWEAVPSRTDLEKNYYGPVPRIIVSLLGATPVVRVWRLDWVLETVVEVLVVGATPIIRVWQLDPESYEELSWRIVEPRSPDPDAAPLEVASSPRSH
jgi:proteasome lid subunit RPN8/RPN11